MSIFGSLRKAGINYRPGQLRITRPLVVEAGITLPVGIGTVYYLDPTNGADTNDGLSPSQAFATLAVAYAALTTLKNDALVILYHGDAVALTAAFTWAKSSCHLIGVGGPQGGITKGVPITMTSATATGLFVVSGDNNTFHNIHWSHLGTAAALISVGITGDGNSFHDCQFNNMNNAASADEATMKGVTLDGCNNTSFFRCTIGGTETTRTDGAADMTIGAGTILGLYMEDCIWIADLDAAADADHAFIEQVADADLGDYAYLVRPTFINAGAVAALPDAMTVGAATTGFWLLRDPLLVYVTDIADNEEKVWIQGDGRDTTPGKFVGIAINPDVA